ncbi:hypothetical protein BDK61_4759 [Haloarcula quadrata]|jgi:hypothetical protein|uniref:Uncharacterized protein n=1 Tax=Haloarcula quadrata TaxID=182779 RepID=A0A495QMG7_9EURY|nr:MULTISPECIES: hypothetical protein [Haloarcula]NHN65948.1 hypothetical protein [Haloarcula sp. JP-Z28]RKS74173.1 hypothetical protein BDK61_4759 [Haloarcula quadrata]
MPEPCTADAPTDSSTYREYILGVRIVEQTTGDRTRYRFKAPDHEGIEFDDPEMATLYADVYFDVNGFQEAETGKRGVPPTIIQAGRDTLVAYFLTQDSVDVHWAASFYGEKPEKIERYVSRVRKRSEKIREGAKEQNHA